MIDRLFLIAALLLSVAVPATAQTGAPAAAAATPTQAEAPAPNDDVTVTGDRGNPKKAREAARNFVHQSGIAYGVQPAGRWWGPVCPRALNLAPDHQKFIEERIRAAARAAGAKVGPANCKANLGVIFIAGGAGLARAIADVHPDYIHDVENEDRRWLLKGEGPIRWWYLINRVPIETAEAGARSFRISPAELTDLRVISGAIIVVDVERAAGVKLGAVADFAAMVGLVEVRHTEAPPPNSILALFTGAARDGGITARDRQVMSTVYRLQLYDSARHHRHLLTDDLVAAAIGPKADAAAERQ